MKNRFINFISLVIPVVIFVSCCNKDDNYYDLSSEELSILPYKINDSIVLKNLQNDTITFLCENTTKEYLRDKEGKPLCENDIYIQILNVSFISNNASSLKLEMTASLTSSFARMYLYFENSENLTISNTIHTVIDSIYVNGILYTEVHRFKQQSKDNQFYVKSNKGLIKIKSFEIIYELIE